MIQEKFKLRENRYNLPRDTILESRPFRTQKCGIESIYLAYLAPKIWSLVPSNIKNSAMLNIFKSKIKTWSTSEYPCKLCKIYIYIPSLAYLKDLEFSN